MALMYGGAQNSRMVPSSDGSSMPLGRLTPQSLAQGAAFQISQMEKQLMDMQRRYGMMGMTTSNPQQLFAMQSEMQKLQQQIEWAKRNAQQQLAMSALRAQQMGQMPGMSSVGVGGRGGTPNQAMLDQSQQIAMLTNMFGGAAGSPYRNY